MGREKRRRGKEEDDNIRSTRYPWEGNSNDRLFKVCARGDVNDSWNFPTGFVPTSITATMMTTTTIQRSLVLVTDGFSGTTPLYSPVVSSINKKYVCTRCISPRSLNHTDGFSVASDKLLLLVGRNKYLTPSFYTIFYITVLSFRRRLNWITINDFYIDLRKCVWCVYEKR